MKLVAMTWLGCALLITQVLLGGSSVYAMPPAHRPHVTGNVSIHFAISGAEHGSATLTDRYHVVRAPDDFSGCAIKSIPLLHSRELIVQIFPQTLAEQLQRHAKLTITLTRSGQVDPVQTPVLSMMWKARTYVNFTGKPRTKITAGGLNGSFDIPQFRDVSTGQNSLEAKGSWHCSSLLHFTAR